MQRYVDTIAGYFEARKYILQRNMYIPNLDHDLKMIPEYARGLPIQRLADPSVHISCSAILSRLHRAVRALTATKETARNSLVPGPGVQRGGGDSML